jgi:hypothetical protein
MNTQSLLALPSFPVSVFLVYRNSDLNAGDGPMTVVAVCDTLNSALLVAYDQPGIQGRDRQWPAVDTEIYERKLNSVGPADTRYWVAYRWDEPTFKATKYGSTVTTVLPLPEWWAVPKPR